LNKYQPLFSSKLFQHRSSILYKRLQLVFILPLLGLIYYLFINCLRFVYALFTKCLLAVFILDR